MKNPTIIICILFGALFLIAEDREVIAPQPVQLLPGMMGKSEKFRAEIKKVYRAESKEGAVFQAFAVDWEGAEVIVWDIHGASKKGVGDSLTVLMVEFDMPINGNGAKMLQFISMDDYGFD